MVQLLNGLVRQKNRIASFDQLISEDILLGLVDRP